MLIKYIGLSGYYVAKITIMHTHSSSYRRLSKVGNIFWDV